MKRYSYVGPEAIRKSLSPYLVRCCITSIDSFRQWSQATNQHPDSYGLITATFIVDLAGWMWISDRHSEHVACAQGQDVLAAGEITFSSNERKPELESVSNQSTGYCPEPRCWSSVSAALQRAGISPPSGFEPCYLFRRCERCEAINIVKDSYYVCSECESELNRSWNFGGDTIRPSEE